MKGELRLVRRGLRTFHLYSGLSDCAERAINDDCDGAATAASGSAADTVTVSAMLATVNRIERSTTTVPSSTPEGRRWIHSGRARSR